MKQLFYVLMSTASLLSLTWSNCGQAETTMFFEPAQVGSGESSQLIFQSDNPIKKAPDLKNIEQLFVISGQQTKQSYRNINGKSSRKYQLIYNVFPKKSGSLSTGDVNMNGNTIKSAELMVSDQPSMAQQGILKVDAELQVPNAYPDETVLYTIKVIENVGILDGEIRPPVLKNAKIEALDMDKTYQTTQDGKNVRVFEKTFAITPQESGILTIPSTEFYGFVPIQPMHSNRKMFDLFDNDPFFGRMGIEKKEILLTSPEKKLTVLAKPTNWSGWWLPSPLVNIHAKDIFPDVIHVGDSLERHITLSALNLKGEQLPLVQQDGHEGIKIYPSPEKRETIQTPQKELQGLEQVSLIIIPQKVGSLMIPEIKVPWFNTAENKIEFATIPEKEIQVLAASSALSSNTSINDTKRSIPETNEEKTVLQPNKNTNVYFDKKIEDKTNQSPKKSYYNLIQYTLISVLSILFGGIAGFILGIFYESKKRETSSFASKIPLKSKKDTETHEKKPLPDLYPF